jgi:hypothetical protein
MMQPIDALPVELWISIFSLLSREDLLRFRLCSSRIVLSMINRSLFEELYINVPNGDEVQQRSAAAERGRVANRMRAVSRSEIVQHVRVLVLQISNDYGSAAYPGGYSPVTILFSGSSLPLAITSPKKTGKVAIKSQPIFKEILRSGHHKSREVSLPVAVEESSPPTIRFALAIAYLLQATRVLTTIRIVRSLRFPLSYDIAYPTTYARAILRLLDGLSRVESVPSLVTLELCDCPFAHMSEASVRIDKTLASQAMKKIKRLKLTSLGMAYNIRTSSWPRRNPAVDLLDIFKNASHLEGLSLSTGRDEIYKNYITSATQFEHLIQVEFGLLFTDASTFGSFIAGKLKQLEVLIIAEGHVNEPGSWTKVFEVWMQRKSEMSARGQPLKLVVLRLVRLFDGSLMERAVPLSKIAALTYQLCPPRYAFLPIRSCSILVLMSTLMQPTSKSASDGRRGTEALGLPCLWTRIGAPPFDPQRLRPMLL